MGYFLGDLRFFFDILVFEMFVKWYGGKVGDFRERKIFGYIIKELGIWESKLEVIGILFKMSIGIEGFRFWRKWEEG